MKPGARRARSLAVVVVLAVAVFAGTWAVAFLARPEHVVRLTAQAAVAANGSAQVSETIDYRFSGIDHHGIYRDVPGLAADTPGITATDNGRPAQVLTTANEVAQPDAHIRIGDPARTISGDHAYLVTYPLPTVIDVNGKLDWNGVGTGWGVDIDRTDLDVSGPWTWIDPTCQQGAEGSTNPCTVTQPEPGLLTVHVGHLGPHQGVTVEAGRGAALAAAPALPLGCTGALAAVGHVALRHRRGGRAGRSWWPLWPCGPCSSGSDETRWSGPAPPMWRSPRPAPVRRDA